MTITSELTERQQRELDYHKEHAELHQDILQQPFCFDVVEDGPRRWWNQYWAMYTYLLDKGLKGKQVLVVGCGFGEDALNLAKAGAIVKAFDLSPESIDIASKVARKENLSIEFRQMTAENLDYPDDHFDIVVARDILHHVEIPETFNEILRVSKKGAILCFNEIYSHSFTHKIRYSKFVDKWLYPKMTAFIYRGRKPYITEDEDKLTEKEVRQLVKSMESVETTQYFNCFVTRIIPEKYVWVSKLDQRFLRLFSPIAYMFGSRVLIGGAISKPA